MEIALSLEVTPNQYADLLRVFPLPAIFLDTATQYFTIVIVNTAFIEILDKVRVERIGKLIDDLLAFLTIGKADKQLLN